MHTTSLALRHLVSEDARVLHRLNGEESTRLWLSSHVYSDLSHARAAVAYLTTCYSSPGDAKRVRTYWVSDFGCLSPSARSGRRFFPLYRIVASHVGQVGFSIG